MIERLLVGLDGSMLAEAVLPVAEQLAQASGGQLLLVRATAGATLEVVGHPSGTYLRYAPGIRPASGDPAATSIGVREAEIYLEGLAAGLRSRGVRTETIVSAGEPADVLVEQAILRHADLILLTTHGRTGLNRLVAGSVTETVLAQAHVPVMLVGSNTKEPEELASGEVRLLVPLDGSLISERSLASVRKLAHALGAKLLLTKIVAPPAGAIGGDLADFTPLPPGSAPDEDEPIARAYLDEVAQSLRADGFRVSTTVRTDHPSDGILAVARDYRATCIVMGTHGRTGLTRAFLGSVALSVLRQGALPVLLIGPGVHTYDSRLVETAAT